MNAPGSLSCPGFPMRDAFADWEHVPSRLMTSGETDPAPHVTIAIPTFRRPDFLLESVASALEQRFDRSFEILIVDNDPASQGHLALLDRLPALAKANLRYFVNAENIGMFGNWNRCIELARSEWITILNDDDMLDPDFLRTMFATLDRRRAVDGLVCRKRTLDQRTDQGAVINPVRRLGKQAILETSFRRQDSRRIPSRKFFWGALLGNGGGFLFRKRCAVAIGGYYPEEFPSGDQWFYARFATCFHLRQHRAELASIRTAENESMRPETARASITCMVNLQEKLLGAAVPKWWRRFIPLTVARDMGDLSRHLLVEVPREELGAELNMSVRERPYRLWATRILLRGL